MQVNSTEEEILKFWKKNKVFEKSVEEPAGEKPKGNFIFYDGPPFITGLPHYATLLPSIVKDAVPRFWTMKGYRVERIWGWDCHGLPAENKVEKELGLKNKKDIEKLGVGKFVNSCKTYVNNVSGQWEWYIDKVARWVDLKNAYRTMDKEFMESVIWAFKQLYDKGLIYEGYRTSLHCPRCATPLSKFEVIMDAGSYKDVTEMSVIVEFPLKGEKNTSVLAWTTTPWTLPGNMALAVGKDIDYIMIEKKDEGVGDLVRFILAKAKLDKIFGGQEYKIIKKFKGKELVGKEYEPLFELNEKEVKESEKVYRIYDADFVSTEEGTGVVHIAPNFGEDDFEFGKKHKLPVIELMDENGIYKKDLKTFGGLYFKDANKKVLDLLKDRLFLKFNHTHSYPFCYRCETPLIFKTQKAWYLDIDKVRAGMLKTNKKINWVPDYFGQGRFKYNIESAPHWCLSRSRYWGSPIPVWKCVKCDEVKVLGSIKDIEKLSGRKVDDLHMPAIDKHELKCSCKGVMKRVPEVLDCWFESGSMPFAQWHYPFKRKNELKEIFPADFIIEYTGQLRGWFYYLHVLSNSLFNSAAFKNVIVTGVLAGTDGRKMSKSYGNYPDPKETLEKYGGDAIRMYFLSSPIILGGDMNLNEKDIQNSLRKNVMLSYNVCNFYEQSYREFKEKKSNNILDKWIVSRLNEFMKEVTENLESYNLPGAARPITNFVEDLSTWYVRLNRDRFNDGDESALTTLRNVLETTSKVIAPFMPYVSEHIWQIISGNNFKQGEKSVHLEKWPKYDAKLIDKKLLGEMKLVQEIVSQGLKERDNAKVGLRWPLQKVIVYNKQKNVLKNFEEIIKSELNVKELELKSPASNGTELVVELDIRMTKELEAEGYARELSRQVQAFRKQLGLVKDDKIELRIFTDDDFRKVLEFQEKFLKERTNSTKIEFSSEDSLDSKETFKNNLEFKIKDKKGRMIIIR